MADDPGKAQEPKVRPNRTFICSVVFIDIVAYSQKPVDDQMRLKERFNGILTQAIRDVPTQDRIILDTGDGASIGFLGDPEDALIAAMGIQGAIRSLPREEAPLLEARIGINLGPVKLIKDINDNPNLVGDGINVAQRIMSFAAPGELLVSRSYFEVVSRLSEDYGRLFEYRGARADKHVREHDIYQVTPPAARTAPPPEPEPEPARAAPLPEPPAIAIREDRDTPAREAPVSPPPARPAGTRRNMIPIAIGGVLLAALVVVILFLVPGGKKPSPTGKAVQAPKTAKEQRAPAASAPIAEKGDAEKAGETGESREFRIQSLKADEIVFTLSEARAAGKQVTLVIRARNQSRVDKSIALYDAAYRWTKSSITSPSGPSSFVTSVYSLSGGKKTTMAQAGTSGLPVAAGSTISIYLVFPAPAGFGQHLKNVHLHPFIYQGRSWKEHSLNFRNVAFGS